MDNTQPPIFSSPSADDTQLSAGRGAQPYLASSDSNSTSTQSSSKKKKLLFFGALLLAFVLIITLILVSGSGGESVISEPESEFLNKISDFYDDLSFFDETYKRSIENPFSSEDDSYSIRPFVYAEEAGIQFETLESDFNEIKDFNESASGFNSKTKKKIEKMKGDIEKEFEKIRFNIDILKTFDVIFSNWFDEQVDNIYNGRSCTEPSQIEEIEKIGGEEALSAASNYEIAVCNILQRVNNAQNNNETEQINKDDLLINNEEFEASITSIRNLIKNVDSDFLEIKNQIEEIREEEKDEEEADQD